MMVDSYLHAAPADDPRVLADGQRKSMTYLDRDDTAITGVGINRLDVKNLPSSWEAGHSSINVPLAGEPLQLLRQL